MMNCKAITDLKNILPVIFKFHKMKQFIISSVFFLFIVYFYTPNESKAQNDWLTQRIEKANCAISFPSEPEFSNQPFLGWSSKDKDGQVTYLIAFIEEPNERFTIADIERFLLPSMFSSDQQISKNYLRYEGFEAIDFLYQSNNSPVLYKKGRVVIRDHKIYVMQVLYYHDDLQNFERFVNSLSFF